MLAFGLVAFTVMLQATSGFSSPKFYRLLRETEGIQDLTDDPDGRPQNISFQHEGAFYQVYPNGKVWVVIRTDVDPAGAIRFIRTLAREALGQEARFRLLYLRALGSSIHPIMAAAFEDPDGGLVEARVDLVLWRMLQAYSAIGNPGMPFTKALRGPNPPAPQMPRPGENR